MPRAVDAGRGSPTPGAGLAATPLADPKINGTVASQTSEKARTPLELEIRASEPPPSAASSARLTGKAVLDERIIPKSTRPPRMGREVSPASARDAGSPRKAHGRSAESDPPVTLDAEGEPHDDDAFFAADVGQVHARHFGPPAFDLPEPRARLVTQADVIRVDRLRRVVTVVVAVAGAACLFVAVRLSQGKKPADPPRRDPAPIVVAAQPLPPAPAVTLDPTPTAAPAPAALPPGPPGGSSTPSTMASAPSAPLSGAASAPSPAPAASDAASPSASAPAAVVDPAQTKKLIKSALSALESGNNRAAVERSSAAVEADPTDATGYLYWGTALMNMGKLGDAKKVFKTCVDVATRGPKSDCRQFR